MIWDGGDPMDGKTKPPTDKHFIEDCRKAQEFCVDYLSESFLALMLESVPDPILRNDVLAELCAKNCARHSIGEEPYDRVDEFKTNFEDRAQSHIINTDSDLKRDYELHSNLESVDRLVPISTLNAKATNYFSTVIKLTKISD